MSARTSAAPPRPAGGGRTVPCARRARGPAPGGRCGGLSRIRERSRAQFPQVLLTLLSILQALALELLWSEMGESPYLWQGGLAAWIGWLQVGAVTQGILLVWLFYTSMVMRLSWVPSMRDSLYPFAIGLLEFNMIELLGPERPALWLLAMAATFATSSVASTDTFERARRDPENRELFAKESPGYGRFAGLVPTGSFCVALALAAAAAVGWTDGFGAVALVAVVLTNAALFAQTLLIRAYWRRSIEGG